MKSLLLKIPMYGRVLFGLSGLFLVIALGFYGVARFGGQTIQGPPDEKPFHWKGGTLLLEATDRHHTTTCTVKPAGGAQRAISLAGTDNPGEHSTKLQPWFSGTATTTCTQSVMAYSGSQINRREFSESSRFRSAAPGLVAAPIVLFLILGVLRRAFRG